MSPEARPSAQSDLVAEIYRDDLNRLRFRLVSRHNGENIAPASQGYSRRIDMLSTLMSVLGAEYDEEQAVAWRHRPDGTMEWVAVADQTNP